MYKRQLQGGGLANDVGATTLTGVAFRDQQAKDGGAVAVQRGAVTISGGRLQDSRATGHGGAAVVLTGQLTISGATLRGNEAVAGGGLFAGGGAIAVRDTTLVGNTAGDGGGLFAALNGAITVVNSTLSGNTANVAGGGVYNAGRVTLTNATVSGNTAGVSGGGAFVSSGTLTLRQSLLAGNTAPLGREAHRAGGSVAAAATNLFGFGGDSGVSGFAPGAGDFTPVVWLPGVLLPLADNGGTTPTHALPLHSPAIDRAPSAVCAAAPVSALDQRGRPRNRDGNGLPSANECDVGALEAASKTPQEVPLARLPFVLGQQ